jgi:hypothetical protein
VTTPNTNPDLLLDDGAPVTCYMMLRDDAPHFWTRCENNATVALNKSDRSAFDDWRADHPGAIIMLYPSNVDGTGYLCDTHERVLREIIG